MTKKIKVLFEEKPNATLEETYEFVCQNAPDIGDHCPTLAKYARKCDHVTEMGTRWGASTVAFLYGQPKRLICYDHKKKEHPRPK